MNLDVHLIKSRLVMLGLVCFVVFGAARAADGHPRPNSRTAVARLGHPFKLRTGQQVTLAGVRLRIIFTGVTEDSRCPADVQCVWAGNAAVRLEVGIGVKKGKSLTLNSNSRSSANGEGQYQGYKFKLVDLSPYPRSGQKIATKDYTATLLVNKEPSTTKAEASDVSAETSDKAVDTEKLILQLEKEGRDATLNNDVPANDRLLADNWMNINPDGSVTTKAQLMKLLKAASFRIKAIENDEVLVRAYGTMAVVTGHSTTTRAGQGDEIVSRQVRFTRVYDGSNGRWQVVSAHNTLITRP